MNPRLGALLAATALLSTVVLIAAFAGGGQDSGGVTEASSRFRPLDGVLTRVADTELVLQPYAAGAQPQRLEVRPEDRGELDLPHLQQHVEDGTPVRIFVERAAGRPVARGYQDLLG